jgi:hypothetical protein
VTIQSAVPSPPADPYDFSLVLGGPLYQLLRRTHLAGDALDLVRRRIVVIALFAWLPLLVLSALAGDAWGSHVSVPFLRDVDTHVRFLVALPLLVAAELVVHARMRPLVRQFVDRGMRNSVVAELAMIAFVYGIGVMVWKSHMAVDVPTWYGVSAKGDWQPSLAGWWFGYVSLPLFQFIFVRWYFRLFVWIRFLWHVSRIDLKLVPTHPDRCAGLGFLPNVCTAFAPWLLAQGTLLSGTIANQIFFAGAQLPQFKVEIVTLVALMVFVVFGPLLVFAPRLARTRRTGLREYGVLAQRYVREFDQKWLRGSRTDEAFVGSADIQSLADLGNSFEIVRSMRAILFTRDATLQLVVLTLLPLLPLLLTMISVEQLLDRLLKIFI